MVLMCTAAKQAGAMRGPVLSEVTIRSDGTSREKARQ